MAFSSGDLVLIIDPKGRRYMFNLETEGSFIVMQEFFIMTSSLVLTLGRR